MPPPTPPPDAVDPNLWLWFKSLVIIEAVSLVVIIPCSVANELILSSQFPDTETMYGVVDGAENIALVLVGLMVLLLPVVLASWVGLLLKKNWARWLYLIVTAIGITLELSGGLATIELVWGFINAIGSVESLLNGAILALAFLTPLKDAFK